jgi:hypothetical protein
MASAQVIAIPRGDCSALVEIADVGGKQMSIVESDIGSLEKAVNTLVRRPRLIRQEYWASAIGLALERPGVTARDRQRLLALLDLLDTIGCDRPAHSTASATGQGNGHCAPVALSTSQENLPS